MPLKLYKKRYEDIIHSDLIDRKKNLKLIQLMMDMESAFSVSNGDKIPNNNGSKFP